MKITKKQIDELNIELTIALQGEDYAEQEKKRLSVYRRNADLKGFRRGMAPLSLISRLYGDQALYDVVNASVSEQLDKFIKDNQLNILGEPLPSASQKEMEWKSGNDFEFKFDLGLSPEIDLDVTKEDKVPYYKIDVTDQAKAEMKENLLKQQGQLEEGEAAGEEDYVVADLSQGDKNVEGAYIAVRNVAGAARKKFLGAKVGDKFQVDVNKAFENENDRSSLLKIRKEELAALAPEWDVTIVNVKVFVPAEENQETFDKLFGKDSVKSSEEFEKRIAGRLEANYKQEADYRLSRDLRNYLVEKAGISVPEEFLKRWLYENNREKFTKDQVEQEFNNFLEDFRWQLVRSYLLKKFELKIEDRDMQEAARAYAAYQYAMYGMGNVPEDLLDSAASRMLSDERQARNLEENVENEKVIAAVREKLTLQNKKISLEKFQALK